MALEEIASTGDTQALAKTNAAIREAKKIADKADQAALSAALVDVNEAIAEAAADLGGRLDQHGVEVASLYPGMQERPGDRRELFTSSLTGGGKAQASVSVGEVVAGQDGSALRVIATGPDPLVVAARTDQATEAGQVYAARVSVRRNKNTSDPLGDAIQFGISCLNAAKQKVSERIFFEGSVVSAEGLISRQVTFSRDQEAELTLSETTRYVRPFVRIFGGDGITDVVVVGTWETDGPPGPQGNTGDLTPAAQAAADEIKVNTGTVERSTAASLAAAAIAEAARDASTTSADVFGTTALGLAAKPTTGQQFQVIDASGLESVRYVNVAGAAAEVPGARMPTAKAIELQDDNQLLNSLPEGLVGLWPVNRYRTLPTPHIPNIALKRAPSRNLLRGSRRLFSTVLWFKSGVVVTDNAALDPNGKMEASKIVGTGNWQLRLGTIGFVGPKTIAVTARRSADVSVDQVACLYGNTKSPVLTFGAAYQRYTFTFTGVASGTTMGLYSSDGTTGASLEICDLEVYDGNVDLGPSAPDGNAYYGATAYSGLPAYAAGLMPPAYGLVQFPTEIALDRWTAQTLVSIKGNAANVFIGKLLSWAQFQPASENSQRGVLDPTVGGFAAKNTAPGHSQGGAFQPREFLKLLNTGPRVITLRYDGARLTYWVDDVMLTSDVSPRVAAAIRDVTLHAQNFQLSNHEQSGFTAVWSLAISDVEVRHAIRVNQNRARADGIGIDSNRKQDVLVVCGDSNTARTYSWAIKYVAEYNTLHPTVPVQGSQWAVSGAILADLIACAPDMKKVIPPIKRGGSKYVYLAMIGTNDLGGYTGGSAAYITALRAHCNGMRDAGYTVVLLTTLPEGTGVNEFETRRVALNADMVANKALYGATAVINYSADPYIGVAGSPANPANAAYWETDQKHIKDFGQAYLKDTYVKPVLDALLATQ